MGQQRNAPSDAELAELFDNPAPVAANTFEFALVLGGTVSAGAYTAGAVDFLIDALDSWTRLRDQGLDAPRHKALLRFITGTSGGGVNTAIAARALAYDFPHILRGMPDPTANAPNPFYETWVNRLDLKGFLATGDVDKDIVSLLNGKPIDEGAAFIETYVGGALEEGARSYLADPLRIMLTLTNLRGIPYRTEFGTALDGTALVETFIDHADHARFAIVFPTRTLAAPRPDELVLGFGDARLPGMTDWASFGQFACATAAFPLGFPARALKRPLDHYRYRPALIPGAAGQPARLIARCPDWAALTPEGAADPPADYDFLVVDGGATNNEPIALARNALAGMTGRNPRDGSTADRGVLLIDPFAGQAGLGPTLQKTFIEFAGSIVNGIIQQTRYDTQDLLLAADPDVFSRFMITPFRDGTVGGNALAGAGFGAFIGFACRAFRRHDYFLGRANCQEYLRTKFVLAENNPVFAGCWTDAQKDRHATRNAAGRVETDAKGNRYLPIIPLVGTAAVTEMREDWPKGALKPEDFRDAIETRFKSLVEAEGSGNVLSSVAAWLVAHLGQGKIADLIISKMRDALNAAGLS
jgi:hypothetical protein